MVYNTYMDIINTVNTKWSSKGSFLENHPRYIHALHCKHCGDFLTNKTKAKSEMLHIDCVSDYKGSEAYKGAHKLKKETCELCGARDRLHIDHDHITNKVRGVLCSGCNNKLGSIGDNAEFINKALEYLNKST